MFLAGALLALASAPVHAADGSGMSEDSQGSLSVEPESDTAVSPEVAATLRARVTYYVQSGLMASGLRTHPGAAACSTNLSFYTRLRLPDGRIVTCLDRGLLGNGRPISWVDIYSESLFWGRENIAKVYGEVTTVEVLAA